MRYRYKIGLIVTVLLMALCLMTYQSYALWIVSLHGDEENVVEIGCFSISFEELENLEEGSEISPEETTTHKNIHLTNTYPMNDTKGLNNTPYIFKIKNTCSINSKYHVTLNTPNTNTLDDQYIKFVLYKNDAEKPTEGKNLEVENEDTKDLTTENLHFSKDILADSYLLESGVLKQDEEVTYNLILWMGENADNNQMGKKFEASVNIINAATNEGNTPQTEEQTVPFPDVIADSLDESGNGLITQVHEKETTGDEILAEGFEKSELRYVGKTPKNYVWFNCDEGYSSGTDHCELWRIIGLVNVKTTSGNVEQRVKLIRSQPLGDYAWDRSEDSEEHYSNNWSNSKLMEMLNQSYYGSVSDAECYISTTIGGLPSSKSTCNFENNGIKDSTQKYYIADDISWNLGGNDEEELVATFYRNERGNNVNDRNPDKWEGRIGLMYVSDYGYATGGGEDNNRNSCLMQNLSEWENLSDCYTNNWLYTSKIQLTLDVTTDPITIYWIWSKGGVSSYATFVTQSTSPVLYLKSNVYVNVDENTENQEPNGSENHPFILTLEE